MDCHGDHHEQRDHEGNERRDGPVVRGGVGRHKHLIMMAACCGLPILALALLPLLRGAGGGLYDKIARYSFLLCPLMMIPMMFMHRGGGRAGSRKE